MNIRLTHGDGCSLTSESEDMRSFFDPHVDRVIELIQDHVLQIEDKNSMVAVSNAAIRREVQSNIWLGYSTDRRVQ